MDFYITQAGTLHRETNTIYFTNNDEVKTCLPVNIIENIYIFSEHFFKRGVGGQKSFLLKTFSPPHNIYH